MLFASLNQGEVFQISLNNLQHRIASETGTVSLGLTEAAVQNRLPITAFVAESNLKMVQGIVLPVSLLDQAWRSRRADILLIEIRASLTRLGYEFHQETIADTAQFSGTSIALGHWNGFRNFSKRAKGRNGGEAESGSVLSETLEVLGNSMPRYAQWLKEQTLAPEARRVLEIGAGTGTMTVLFSENAYVVAFEPAESTREILIENTQSINRVSVVSSMEEAASLGPYDEVLLINVLEHVEHDTALLRKARQLLAQGGRVTVLSPAHNMLFSDFDASIGHVRRYTRTSLARTFELSGFSVVESRYFNAIGAVLWFAVNRVFGKSEANTGQTKLYDQVIVPVSVLVNRLGIRPFGQSVIAHGRG